MCLRTDFPEKVAALEHEHSGILLDPAQLRDYVNEDTPVMIDDGSILVSLPNGWAKVSRTDLWGQVWSHHHMEDIEEARKYLTRASPYGAIFSVRDGLILIDSMTDG